jgi:hypothetical protein
LPVKKPLCVNDLLDTLSGDPFASCSRLISSAFKNKIDNAPLLRVDVGSSEHVLESMTMSAP